MSFIDTFVERNSKRGKGKNMKNKNEKIRRRKK